MSRSITGYLIFADKSDSDYRGVDRDRFEPVLTEELLSRPKRVHFDHIWQLAEGWLRDAYRLYEENLIDETSSLLVSEDVAQAIKHIIEPHLGRHEILQCVVQSPSEECQALCPSEYEPLGFDVAYLGGDFYSAIRNGLITNPKPELRLAFQAKLNEHRLFDVRDIAATYLAAFKSYVASEAGSEFLLYWLCRQTN